MHGLTWHCWCEQLVLRGPEHAGRPGQPDAAEPACDAAPPPAAPCPGSGCGTAAPSTPAAPPAHSPLAPAAPTPHKHNEARQPVLAGHVTSAEHPMWYTAS